MVRAILDGTKTQTRRICKTTKDPDTGCEIAPCEIGLTFANRLGDVCPFGTVGDRLWVRETWQCAVIAGEHKGIGYRAGYDDDNEWFKRNDDLQWFKLWDKHQDKWRPSIFMPRWASRITLEITGVRVDRLNEIRAMDCIAEGIESHKLVLENATLTTFRNYKTGGTNAAATTSYQTLWESINGPGSWAKNPYVWVIEFQNARQLA